MVGRGHDIGEPVDGFPQIGVPPGAVVLGRLDVVEVDAREERVVFDAGAALCSKAGLGVRVHEPDQEALEGPGEPGREAAVMMTGTTAFSATKTCQMQIPSSARQLINAAENEGRGSSRSSSSSSRPQQHRGQVDHLRSSKRMCTVFISVLAMLTVRPSFSNARNGDVPAPKTISKKMMPTAHQSTALPPPSRNI